MISAFNPVPFGYYLSIKPNNSIIQQQEKNKTVTKRYQRKLLKKEMRKKLRAQINFSLILFLLRWNLFQFHPTADSVNWNISIRTLIGVTSVFLNNPQEAAMLLSLVVVFFRFFVRDVLCNWEMMEESIISSATALSISIQLLNCKFIDHTVSRTYSQSMKKTESCALHLFPE